MYNPNSNPNPSASANIYLRSLYSPGFSSLVISFFKGKLIFKLVPYVSTNPGGYHQYSKNDFLSTSVGYDGASYFFMTGMSILLGEESNRQVVAEYHCPNGTILTLENKPDENNQMRAYLIIEKNNKSIPFRFNTLQYQIISDGRRIEKTNQSGLGVFVMALKGYLMSTGINAHLSNLPEEMLGSDPAANM